MFPSKRGHFLIKLCLVSQCHEADISYKMATGSENLMNFKQAYFAYAVALLLFLSWIIVLALSTEKNALFTYGLLQVVLYLCIVLDLYKQNLLRLLTIVGFVYKCFLFIYGLQWIRDATGYSCFDLAMGMQWLKYSILTKAVFLDLMIMICILSCFVVLVTLVCVGGCLLVCISPFLPEDFMRKKPKKLNFEKCFSKSKAMVSDVCCICLVEYDEHTAQSNSCGHLFHASCIKEWIDSDQSSCPMCKQQFGNTRIVVAVNKV
jgi:hypothetical protein